MKTVKYNVGIYCRLSKDDNVKKNDESMSISNQKDMLIKYVDEMGWNLKRIYADDGFTGTNFDRPQFKEMIQDIEAGKINMVVTKDLSRLGRNYSQTGHYTDSFFPDNNVRYIALNDGIDTQVENDITPFKHVLNEMYAKDISRKTRSAKKSLAEQGKFINSRAPYGYQKSLEDKHKLMIDENVADIVKRIYDMFLGGMSGRHIADVFNCEGIPTPNDYYYSTIKKPNPRANQSKRWGSGTILQLLKNPVYCGDMAQGKRQLKSFKNRQVLYNSSDLWIVVKNTHEPIIERSTWGEAQRMISSNHVNIRRSGDGDVSIFSGVLKCADCGKKMTYDRRVHKTYVKEYYRCGAYINKGKTACNPHTVRQETLTAAVMAELRQYATLAYDNEQKLIQRLLDSNSKFKEKNICRYEKTLREKENRLKDIDSLIQSLFEEKLGGNVPDNIFKRMAKKYDDEQLQLGDELEQLKAELAECLKTEKDITAWIQKIKKCLSIEKLTRTIVVELIDSIEVSEVYEKDGEQHQDINIKFKFQDVSLQEKRAS